VIITGKVKILFIMNSPFVMFFLSQDNASARRRLCRRIKYIEEEEAANAKQS